MQIAKINGQQVRSQNISNQQTTGIKPAFGMKIILAPETKSMLNKFAKNWAWFKKYKKDYMNLINTTIKEANENIHSKFVNELEKKNIKLKPEEAIKDYEKIETKLKIFEDTDYNDKDCINAKTGNGESARLVMHRVGVDGGLRNGVYNVYWTLMDLLRSPNRNELTKELINDSVDNYVKLKTLNAK